MKKRRKAKYIAVIAVIIVMVIFTCDVRLKTVTYEIETEKVSAAVKIALITDLHSCRYGKSQKTLIKAVDAAKPDVILLGGDIFDDGLNDENAEALLDNIGKRYPCYYVTGNHEYWSGDMVKILELLKKYNITVLNGTYETITLNGQKINICGVDDPDSVVYCHGKSMKKQLLAASEGAGGDNFSILLSHRPEFAEDYSDYGFDLVLCGHAHGGQWRIPGIMNGLYTPDQGLFPPYAGGRYEIQNTTLIVSRGLARESTLAPRIFNRPEFVVITVK